MEPTPTVFPIRANFSFVPGRWWRVKVALAPGRIVYSPGRRFEFVHTNQLVYVVHSRLFPPPTMLTHSVGLIGRRGYRAYLFVSKRSLDRLRPALDDVGFVVRDRDVWTAPFPGPTWLPRRRTH